MSGMYYLSPLRYPGGKAALAPFLGSILERLPEEVDTYVEPFAGGGGAALRLLVDEFVGHAVINDINAGIAEMWRSVFHRTDEFVRLIEETPVTVEEWHLQRETYEDGAASGLKRGFATFFLNRTNRSGILGARPIGGLDQTGAWGIDARFNAAELARRVRFVSRYRNRVEVRQLDAVELLQAYAPAARGVMVYADPPYLAKSSDLYLDECDWDTHLGVASALRFGFPHWFVTYDENHRVLSDLYPGHRAAQFSLSHTAGRQRVGTEIAIASDTIAELAEIDQLGPHGGNWLAESA